MRQEPDSRLELSHLIWYATGDVRKLAHKMRSSMQRGLVTSLTRRAEGDSLTQLMSPLPTHDTDFKAA